SPAAIASAKRSSIWAWAGTPSRSRRRKIRRSAAFNREAPLRTAEPSRTDLTRRLGHLLRRDHRSEWLPPLESEVVDGSDDDDGDHDQLDDRDLVQESDVEVHEPSRLVGLRVGEHAKRIRVLRRCEEVHEHRSAP